MQNWGLLSLLFLCGSGAFGLTHVTYTGEASKDNKVIYLEHHDAQYDDSEKLLTATTVYETPEGKPLAKIVSDFSNSLTVPTHTIENFRTGNIQGLRWDGNKIVLFDHDKGKDERTKILESSDSDRILVGCQGLNYYLLGNLDAKNPDQTVKLRFLIPGKLDYYDFNLKMVNESPPGIINFEVAIQNWFLRIFAPKLYIKYDKVKKHIIWYKGLSNIPDEKGDLQNVTIDYKYDSAKN